MSDTNYIIIESGPLQAGDEAKFKRWSFWEPINNWSVGTYIKDNRYWQFRRPIKNN
jgi:hypothetical protein